MDGDVIEPALMDHTTRPTKMEEVELDGDANDPVLMVQSARPTPFSFPLKRTALIVIDMQRDFVLDGGYGALLGNDTSKLRRAVPAVRSLLAACRKAGLLVIYTVEAHPQDLSDLHPAKLAHSRGGKEGMGIGERGPMGRILVDSEYGAGILDEVCPLPGEPVVRKPGKGAFYSTSLEVLLQGKSITHLFVCGVTTEVCVQTTCREAADRGYRLALVEECTASYFEHFKAATLEMIAAQGGIVGCIACLEDVLAALAGASGAHQVASAFSRSAGDVNASVMLDGYFAAIRAAAEDRAQVGRVVECFAENAVIASGGREHCGEAAIREFYLSGALSRPGFAPLPIEGSRRTACDGKTIDVKILLYSRTKSILVDDRFVFDSWGRIVRLQVDVDIEWDSGAKAAL